MGETAPTGTGKDVAPLTFLRGALCLNDNYKKRASAPSCASTATRTTRTRRGSGPLLQAAAARTT